MISADEKEIISKKIEHFDKYLQFINNVLSDPCLNSQAREAAQQVREALKHTIEGLKNYLSYLSGDSQKNNNKPSNDSKAASADLKTQGKVGKSGKDGQNGKQGKDAISRERKCK